MDSSSSESDFFFKSIESRSFCSSTIKERSLSPPSGSLTKVFRSIFFSISCNSLLRISNLVFNSFSRSESCFIFCFNSRRFFFSSSFNVIILLLKFFSCSFVNSFLFSLRAFSSSFFFFISTPRLCSISPTSSTL